jgi:lambda family phage tail tape measure protein
MKVSEDETKRRLDQAKVILSIQEREIDNAFEINKLATDGSALMSQFAKNMLTQSLETQRTLDKLQLQLKSLPEYIDMDESMLSAEAKANNDKIDAIKKQMEFEQARHDLKMANLQNERTYEFGYNQAMTSYVENATNAAKTGADSFNALTSNMNSALDSFVKTGKLSFKSLARSIIQDLIAIQMKAAASKILMSMFGGFGGGFNQSGVVMGMPGWADGGDPPVGKPSIVGERGPELFVPKGSGTIIPNHALGGMGSTTNVTNNYINAIDTKSFEERLLGSSNAIWAANSYANKTLATSRGRA